jgi:biopolymer transport protein ExbD
MDFGQPARPPRPEAILPMINLVFLLLIFFLIVATLEPRSPVEPPEAIDAARLEPGAIRIALGADGVTVRDGVIGELALTGLAADLSRGAVVAIDADRRAPAAALARLLADLDARGASAVRLVTEPRR